VDALFEQHIVQNEALGAEALWQAVAEAYESSGRVHGVRLPLIFVVLPIVFHRRSAEVLATRTQPGAVYKALAADRELSIGLQPRMQSMWKKSQRALSLSVASGLVRIDAETDMELTPGRKSSPVGHVSSEVKMIMAASKRIGQALAEMSPIQLMSHLNIRF